MEFYISSICLRVERLEVGIRNFDGSIHIAEYSFFPSDDSKNNDDDQENVRS
jgi:hypothetical protein